MAVYHRVYGFGHLRADYWLWRTGISSGTLRSFRVWDYLTLSYTLIAFSHVICDRRSKTTIYLESSSQITYSFYNFCGAPMTIVGLLLRTFPMLIRVGLTIKFCTLTCRFQTSYLRSHQIWSECSAYNSVMQNCRLFLIYWSDFLRSNLLLLKSLLTAVHIWTSV